MTNSAARDTDALSSEPTRPTRTDREPSGLLLLTPSLRVAGSGADRAPAEPPRSWSLEAQIAELEAVIGARDGADPAGVEGRPRHFRVRRRTAPDPDRSAVQPAPRPPLPAGDPPPLYDENELAGGGFDIAQDDRLPDPDALHDLVAEIVRDELQGELGQRVTRNIRKLVRREIRRALAAREFD